MGVQIVREQVSIQLDTERMRLKEERARFEEQVSAQLDTKWAAMLEKKRKEQEEVKRKQEELNRILF
eukprot:gene4491-14647_t